MSAWCNKCGKILTVDNSYQYEMLSGKKQIKKTYMSNVCRPCKTDEAKIRYNLAKIHTRPLDSKCMCCGRIDKLHITVTIQGNIEVLLAKIATLESATWAIKLRVYNAH